MNAPESTAQSDLVKALTTAGWLAFLSWIFFFFRQVGRVVQVGGQPFADVFDQRVEVMSFFVLPPNSLVLVPAATLACVATWISGPTESLNLAVQLRLIRWGAVIQLVIAAVSIVTILLTETGSPTETQDIALRLSGAAMGGAIFVITRAVEANSPGGAASR